MRSATAMPGANGTTAKDSQRGHHDDGRREHEDRLVGKRRDPVLLDEDLDHVGHDLEQAERAARGWGRSGPARGPAAGARARSARRPGVSTPNRTPTIDDEADDRVALMRRPPWPQTGDMRPQAGRPHGQSARPGRPDGSPATPARQRAGRRRTAKRAGGAAKSHADRLAVLRGRVAPASAGSQADVGRGRELGDAGREHAQLLGAEDVVGGHDEPLIGRRARRRSALGGDARRQYGERLAVDRGWPARSAAGRGRRRAAGRRPRSGTC